ncbi:MAG: hypothetical protein ACIAS6_00720 [Phycisphaerales bacterium JB060]
MRQRTRNRVIATVSVLGIFGALSACKPDVPLIPFIRGQQVAPTPSVPAHSVYTLPTLAEAPVHRDYEHPSSN